MSQTQKGQAEKKTTPPGETLAENRFPKEKDPFRGADLFHKPPDR